MDVILVYGLLFVVMMAPILAGLLGKLILVGIAETWKSLVALTKE